MHAYCEGLVEVKTVTGGNWVERYGRGGVEGRNVAERSVMIKRGRYKWKERERDRWGRGVWEGLWDRPRLSLLRVFMQISFFFFLFIIICS